MLAGAVVSNLLGSGEGERLPGTKLLLNSYNLVPFFVARSVKNDQWPIGGKNAKLSIVKAVSDRPAR